MNDWIRRRPIIAISMACVVVAIGLGIAFVFHRYEIIDFTRKISSDDAQIASTQAAWFQAVFSVIGIFAAVGVGLWQSKEGRKLVQEERGRREIIEENAAYRRRMVYGSIMMRTLIAIHEEAKRRRPDAERQLERYTKMAAGPIRPEALEPYLRPFLLTSVELAPAADDVAERFDLTVAIEVTSALDSAFHFNRALRNLINGNQAKRSVPSEDVVDAFSELQDRLTDVFRKTESAIHRLGNTYGVTGNE
ncbi:hypothetical protein [Pseudoxanthomonas sp. UTMC 1351]|uniref:hypothetical protein n=1 Tax=Pseudoxanthomonas sp. UTMC 1351 TaxID=2695853 RepID=UPI0034CF0FE3